MKTVELQLPEQTASRLQETADYLSLSIEALILAILEEKLVLLDPEFLAAADHVLTKNAELYQRLA